MQHILYIKNKISLPCGKTRLFYILHGFLTFNNVLVIIKLILENVLN